MHGQTHIKFTYVSAPAENKSWFPGLQSQPSTNFFLITQAVVTFHDKRHICWLSWCLVNVCSSIGHWEAVLQSTVEERVQVLDTVRIYGEYFLTYMGPCIVSIFWYISNKMQCYTVYLFLETALHVLGDISTHLQEYIKLYLQHLAPVKPLLLPFAIVEELELVC